MGHVEHDSNGSNKITNLISQLGCQDQSQYSGQSFKPANDNDIMGDMSPSSQRNFIIKELATAIKEAPESPEYLRMNDRQ